MDGFALPSATQIQAMTGASTMIAIELTVWNHAVGQVNVPSWRLTMFSARKVNELPACSKPDQKAAQAMNSTAAVPSHGQTRPACHQFRSASSPSAAAMTRPNERSEPMTAGFSRENFSWVFCCIMPGSVDGLS